MEMLNIRRSQDCFIFKMVVSILVRSHFYNEAALGTLFTNGLLCHNPNFVKKKLHLCAKYWSNQAAMVHRAQQQSYCSICKIMTRLYLKMHATVLCLAVDQGTCCARSLARTPGVGVTKALFINFSVSKNFDLAKVIFRFFEPHS